MAMTFQQEFPNEFYQPEDSMDEESVIELPEEYTNWLDEQQDLGILISLAIGTFADSLEQVEIPSHLRLEFLADYGHTLIAREMGRHPQE